MPVHIHIGIFRWKSGTKSLTLLAVSSILYSVYESGGDWEDAFRK